MVLDKLGLNLNSRMFQVGPTRRFTSASGIETPTACPIVERRFRSPLSKLRGRWSLNRIEIGRIDHSRVRDVNGTEAGASVCQEALLREFERETVNGPSEQSTKHLRGGFSRHIDDFRRTLREDPPTRVKPISTDTKLGLRLSRRLVLDGMIPLENVVSRMHGCSRRVWPNLL